MVCCLPRRKSQSISKTFLPSWAYASAKLAAINDLPFPASGDVIRIVFNSESMAENCKLVRILLIDYANIEREFKFINKSVFAIVLTYFLSFTLGITPTTGNPSLFSISSALLIDVSK